MRRILEAAAAVAASMPEGLRLLDVLPVCATIEGYLQATDQGTHRCKASIYTGIRGTYKSC